MAAWWTVAVGVLVWCGRGGGASLAFALFLVPISIFVALYLGSRSVVAELTGSVLVLTLALVPSAGVVQALVLAVTGTVALAAAPAAVLVLGEVGPSPRHGGSRYRTAQRLRARPTSWPDRTGRAFVVATVVLEGIGNAREALGYQVGTELLRRAVEDLGQVLPSDVTSVGSTAMSS